MPSRVIVRPDKNLFLVYTWLTVWQVDKITRINLPVGHSLREEAASHFQGYVREGLNPGLQTSDDRTLSRYRAALIKYALIHNAMPNATLKVGIKVDSEVHSSMKVAEPFLPLLTHFYEHTDFEDFYQSILPRYQGECDRLQILVDRVNFMNLLNNVWEGALDLPMEIIPMPLEGMGSGSGQWIGDMDYKIIGPASNTFNKSSLYLIAHEGSHPRANKVLEPISEEVNQRRYLEDYARQRVSFKPNVYAWPWYFEEQFIDAVQIAFIDPVLRRMDPQPLDRKFTERKRLKWYKRWGKYFIYDFFSEVKHFKEKRTHHKNLAEVGIAILKRLDIKYKNKIS